MIDYGKGVYGLNLLLRFHGSAVWKATIPGALAAILYLLIAYLWMERDQDGDLVLPFNHPYAIGVFVTSITFLIVFRANNGYQRYWEACGAVHHFMSKWLDAVIHTGVYHLQCDHYKTIKPPSYFDYPNLNRYNLKRERECAKDLEASTPVAARNLRNRRRVEKSVDFVKSERKRTKAKAIRQESCHDFHRCQSVKHSHRLEGPARFDGNWGARFPDDPFGPRATHYNPNGEDDEKVALLENDIPEGFASTKGGMTPALFLQELAHLASLLCAVAMCTLRNDMEGIENPLDIYRVGEPWPNPDPDHASEEVRAYAGHKWSLIKNLKYWCGFSRTPTARAREYASRPMPVIGGVSEAEIAFLQKARGPSAKVTLCWHWLSEFIIREHLAGSLGKVGPPIISRIIQFLSDGMIYYNHARKIMFIPFPFPHAQLSAFFCLLTIFVIPLLMGQYINIPWLGAVLTFLTVTCLHGLHEVARELENPFRNVPNDVPLLTLLAMFNESLITMYSGYHPDHFWDGPVYEERGQAEWEQAKAAKTRLNSNPVELYFEDEGISNNTVGNVSKPQSVDAGKAVVDSAVAELQEMIKKQSEEIERLRQLVEPQNGPDTVPLADNKPSVEGS
uniref:Uncharacterized protein n=2 Tax=Odontella aurita TaxID=265563 RepID=A0A7S4JZA3_9STRA|mmetsp:Transcript_57750/g.172362  ORF Transcript_57750/g.172362 Transcript_57750/m.172362 type:complete len:619 (+) Transcript_57750:308-2164(+)